MPSKLLRDASNVVGPNLLSFINTSLSTAAFKHAMIRPLFKKLIWIHSSFTKSCFYSIAVVFKLIFNF